MFVYLIVNDVNWKIYVGKTTCLSLEHYLQQKCYEAAHYISRRSHLYAAIRSHGREHFHIHPLISNCKTNAELCHWEQVLIKALATQNPAVGYNICRGGEGFTGPHSTETKAKISAAAQEMWQRPETRKSIISKMEKRPVPIKVIEALKARRGTKASLETVEKLRNSHIGRASSRRKPVHCLDTDETFSSLAHVVQRFGGHTTNLSRSIREGYRFFGKRFEYVQQ